MNLQNECGERVDCDVDFDFRRVSFPVFFYRPPPRFRVLHDDSPINAQEEDVLAVNAVTRALLDILHGKVKGDIPTGEKKLTSEQRAVNFVNKLSQAKLKQLQDSKEFSEKEWPAMSAAINAAMDKQARAPGRIPMRFACSLMSVALLDDVLRIAGRGK